MKCLENKLFLQVQILWNYYNLLKLVPTSDSTLLSYMLLVLVYQEWSV